MEKATRQKIGQIVINRIRDYMESDEGKKMIADAVKAEVKKLQAKAAPKMTAKKPASKVETR